MIETTFTTVADIVHHWGRYKDAHNQNYRTMVIVVTDEVGDDEERLEDAIALAQKAKVPVYVLGLAGDLRPHEGYMDYVDPKTKHVFRNVQVRQGPESVAARTDPTAVLVRWSAVRDRRGRLWPVCPQSAGQQPPAGSISSPGSTHAAWGLIRPGCESTSPTGSRRDEYEKEVNRSSLRQAVLTAAQITQQKLPGMPALYFPAADGPEFKEAMSNQPGHRRADRLHR